ncbi:hypothetical protein H2509_13455 [Stappia sp. F7233]|uniref:Uncharacterized protein n=1 Tax=Stappia albiluteola TaxID=2758565 RepID=A0A839AFX8_9HYPH|nr:hypothetical protein [Stappia albiluteola]MBA5777459.1 hypothetical protein [Stappia albiluteola]MBA5777497.1 hypothetical protein [Stappia albiluteola]MBA5778092.1 hypothetical protein [Stappia albiluteola]MBA5778131.1 hypothetical protein [Stappia albiluteola]
MTQAVYRIDLNDFHPDGRRKFFMFECSCRSLAELNQRLQEEKVVYGQRLYTRRADTPGEFEVTGRDEVIVGREAIWQVSTPRHRYFEVEG